MLNSRSDPDTLPIAVRLVTFWLDGFTLSTLPSNINSNPESEEALHNQETEVTFYSYEEDENKKMLEIIMGGHAPLHVLRVSLGQRVELRILDKKTEKYKVKRSLAIPGKPFTGQGNRLGA
jgi:hypothetical protein